MINRNRIYGSAYYTELQFRLLMGRGMALSGRYGTNQERYMAVAKTAVREDGPDRALRADARRNREAVLAAAKQLFRELGLEAQMPDVAKAADVGVGTVYRHFPTKEDLIAALVAEHFERLRQQMALSLEMEDAWRGVAKFLRFAARVQADDRGLCEVMGSRPDLMDAAARAAGLPELCDRLVKRAQRQGELRRDLTWEDIPMIACGFGAISQAAVGPAVGRWPRLVEIILDGLRAPGSAKLPRPL
jgi:AcrR family transcriptional regulator